MPASGTLRPYVRHASQYWKDLTRYPVKRLKFVDESSVNIAMTRLYGRARSGQGVHDAVPQNWGHNVMNCPPRSWTNFKGLHEEVQNKVQARGRPELLGGRRRRKLLARRWSVPEEKTAPG